MDNGYPLTPSQVEKPDLSRQKLLPILQQSTLSSIQCGYRHIIVTINMVVNADGERGALYNAEATAMGIITLWPVFVTATARSLLRAGCFDR